MEPWLCDTCGSRLRHSVSASVWRVSWRRSRWCMRAQRRTTRTSLHCCRHCSRRRCSVTVLCCLHESHHTVLRLCAAFCKSEVSQPPADRQTDTRYPCTLGGGFVLCVAAALIRPPGLPPATLATLRGSVCAAMEMVLLLRCACVHWSTPPPRWCVCAACCVCWPRSRRRAMLLSARPRTMCVPHTERQSVCLLRGRRTFTAARCRARGVRSCTRR